MQYMLRIRDGEDEKLWKRFTALCEEQGRSKLWVILWLIGQFVDGKVRPPK